jgi:hypothetical protein
VVAHWEALEHGSLTIASLDEKVDFVGIVDHNQPSTTVIATKPITEKIMDILVGVRSLIYLGQVQAIADSFVVSCRIARVDPEHPSVW